MEKPMKHNNYPERINLMAHMVAGYPDFRRADTVAAAIVDGGASYLEIQFPYSDPSADGPVIQRACSSALHAGFTKTKGFSFVRETVLRYGLPVFIMSYAGLVYSGGVRTFVKQARDTGAFGLIVPDLTPGYDEELYRFGREAGLAVVPVVAPSINDERLKRVAGEAPEFIYAALRAGVTGDKTKLGRRELQFIRRLAGTGAKICAGFGIRTREQMTVLSPHVHALIIGSMIVGIIEKFADSGDTVLYTEVRDSIRCLVTGGSGTGGKERDSGQKKETNGRGNRTGGTESQGPV